MKVITTSWDDGHPMDFKLAELLNKYDIQATFYIPQSNPERIVMPESGIRELSKHFEIGAHTLNHVRLNIRNYNVITSEVGGSFAWLKGLLGYEPVSFCFPGGKYNKQALNAVYENGFRIVRTTDLLSIERSGPGKLMATTLQVYEHGALTYLRHLVKRGRIVNLYKWLRLNAVSDLIKLTEVYFNNLHKQQDFCFHLWGHSWEIEQYNLWYKLEELFKIISYSSEYVYLQNKDVQAYH